MKTKTRNFFVEDERFMRNVLLLADCEIEILARKDNLKEETELDQWEQALAESAIDHYVGLAGATTSKLDHMIRKAIYERGLVGSHGDDSDLENSVHKKLSWLMNERLSWEDLDNGLDEVVFASDAPRCLVSLAEVGTMLSCQVSRVYALIQIGKLTPQLRDFSIGVCNAEVLNFLGDAEPHSS